MRSFSLEQWKGAFFLLSWVLILYSIRIKDVLEISVRRITELNQKCEIGQCAENKSKKTIKCMIHIQKQWKRFKLIKKDDWRQTSSRPCTLISAWVLRKKAVSNRTEALGKHSEWSAFIEILKLNAITDTMYHW